MNTDKTMGQRRFQSRTSKKRPRPATQNLPRARSRESGVRSLESEARSPPHDAYDGSNFVVRQVFFCGGDQDEFEEWKKGLSDIAKAATKKKAEQTLKVEIDDEAFSRIYGHQSHPFPVKKGQKIAVRVISQFGEETTKVLEAGP
jgi:adenine-specific DNA-methyltransferase